MLAKPLPLENLRKAPLGAGPQLAARELVQEPVRVCAARGRLALAKLHDGRLLDHRLGVELEPLLAETKGTPHTRRRP